MDARRAHDELVTGALDCEALEKHGLDPDSLVNAMLNELRTFVDQIVGVEVAIPGCGHVWLHTNHQIEDWLVALTTTLRGT